MIRGALIAESLRVGAILEGIPLVIRQIYCVAPPHVTAEQPPIWTVIEFEAPEDQASGLATQLSGILDAPGRQLRFPITGRALRRVPWPVVSLSAWRHGRARRSTSIRPVRGGSRGTTRLARVGTAQHDEAIASPSALESRSICNTSPMNDEVRLTINPHQQMPDDARPTATCTVIRNPASRHQLPPAALDAALAIARDAGWQLDVRPTERVRHATEIAREAAERGAAVVLVHGGDGTINEVVNGVAGSETALAVLVAGTANVWAKSPASTTSLPRPCRRSCTDNAAASTSAAPSAPTARNATSCSWPASASTPASCRASASG